MKTSLLAKLVFFSFLLTGIPAFFHTADAQLSAGIEGGYNKNYLMTNNANRAFTNYQPLNGFSIGMPIQYKVNDWFGIAADPSFVQKNYRQVRSAFFTGVYQENRNGYIQLPVMAHFMFGGEKLRGFLNTGIYGSYWATANVQGVMSNILDVLPNDSTSGSIYDYQNPYTYHEKYSLDQRKDNVFAFGWVAGLGLSYKIDNRYQVFAEGRVLYDFTDQQKNYMINQVPKYNSTYGINAGVMFNLGSTKNPY